MTIGVWLPMWVVYGLGVAFLQALTPLVQERFKADAFALTLGIKTVVLLATAPFVWRYGFPHDPHFYYGIVGMSIIWCINDVMYFRAVQEVGAGPVSRILPGSVIITFLLWFLFDPSLAHQYMAEPLKSAAIALCVLVSAFCATRLKNCAVSRRAVRLLWFPILAVVIAPIAIKLILQNAADHTQAPFAYTFVEAAMMMAWLSVFAVIRRPTTWRTAKGAPVLIASLLIGCISAARIVIENFGYIAVEHPSYMSVLKFTDVLWVIIIYKLVGRRETANVRAGLGIVAAAAALVLLKTL